MELENIPYNLDAERAIIGGLLLEQDFFPNIYEIIDDKDFYDRQLGLIFKNMIDLYLSDKSLAPLVLLNQIKKMKYSKDILYSKIKYSTLEETINDIIAETTNTVNITSYAEIVREKSLLRKLINSCSNIIEISCKENRNIDEVINEAEKNILSITNSYEKKEFFSVKDLIKEFLRITEEMENKKDSVIGLPTDYIDLDNKINGLNKSDLIIIAARPGMGKTAFALNIMLNVAKNNKSALFVSLEMSAQQLFQRLMSIESEIPLQTIRNATYSYEEWDSVGKATTSINKTDIKISNDTENLFKLRTLARKLKNDGDLDLIIIDYLQLMTMSSKNESRQQEVSEISRGLKRLAIELDIPIIALSQLSRSVESRENKRPMLSDLRESGAIEQDADIVAFLYRDDYYNPESIDKGITELNIAKHRNGEIGVIKFSFINYCTKFKSFTDMID